MPRVVLELPSEAFWDIYVIMRPWQPDHCSSNLHHPCAPCAHFVTGKLPSYVPEILRVILQPLPEAGWDAYIATRPIQPPLKPTTLAIVSKRLSQVLTVMLGLQQHYTQQVGCRGGPYRNWGGTPCQKYGSQFSAGEGCGRRVLR